MSDAALADRRNFRVLAIWLIFIFLLGGGTRGDIQSLVILRPAAAVMLAYALWIFPPERRHEHRVLLGLAAGLVGLHLLQLVPLPPAMWQALPDRALIAEIDRQAGLGAVWRPISMTPEATRNSLWALLVPGSVLVLVAGLSAAWRRALLPVLLGLGLVSLALALLQLGGDPHGMLFPYRITNDGMPVGLFANRNHHAVFLASLLPMLAMWTLGRGRCWALGGGVIGLVVCGLILVAGSRTAMVIAVILQAVTALSLRRHLPSALLGRGLVVWGGAGGVVLLVLAPVLLRFGQAPAIQRMLETDASGEMRVLMFPVILEMERSHWLLGSGIGSFERLFQVHEPTALLRPFYANHAHNDWLEWLLTGGLPAALLLGAAAGLIVRGVLSILSAGRCDRAEAAEAYARLGLTVLLAFALASLTDYPLRVPSLSCLAIIALIWILDFKPRQLPEKLSK